MQLPLSGSKKRPQTKTVHSSQHYRDSQKKASKGIQKKVLATIVFLSSSSILYFILPYVSLFHLISTMNQSFFYYILLRFLLSLFCFYLFISFLFSSSCCSLFSVSLFLLGGGGGGGGWGGGVV